MKHCRSLLCALLAALLTGCGAVSPQSAEPAQEGYTFFDALGYETTLTSWDRVVSLYGSFAEAWTLAGGTLVGAASDAVEERGLPLGQDTAVVGSVKEPNLEKVLAADPDFVILSADITGQVGLHQALTDAGIPHAYFRTDTFSEYLTMLELFCSMTGREDLYQQNGLVVQEEIDRVKAAVQGQPRPTALLIRAYSTGAKAKGADNLAGVILRDLGADNLAAQPRKSFGGTQPGGDHCRRPGLYLPHHHGGQRRCRPCLYGGYLRTKSRLVGALRREKRPVCAAATGIISL